MPSISFAHNSTKLHILHHLKLRLHTSDTAVPFIVFIMSGFFLFIIITPLCVVTILGIALLSWGTRQWFLYFGSIDHSERSTIDSSQVKPTSRHSSITVDSIDGSSVDNDSSPFEADENVVYPIATIQFLGTQNQDTLHDFLLHISSYIRWPRNKLEILLHIDDNEDEEGGENRSNSPKVKQTRSELTDENYQLILDLMEEGFHLSVSTCVNDLLERPIRGSLLFCFERIEDISHPNFIQNYLMMDPTHGNRSQRDVEDDSV